MIPTPVMLHEAALTLARHQQAQQWHDPEFDPPPLDPAPYLELAGQVLDAALAEAVEREGEVYRADLAAALALVAELQAEVADLKAKGAGAKRWTVVPGDRGAAA